MFSSIIVVLNEFDFKNLKLSWITFFYSVIGYLWNIPEEPRCLVECWGVLS